MTPRPTPTPLTYATHDTQWTLPPWIRTGLLVGVWLTLTADLGTTVWSFYQWRRDTPILDYLQDLFVRDPAYQWFLYLGLTAGAWGFVTIALARRKQRVRWIPLAGWGVLAAAIVPTVAGAGFEIQAMRSAPDLERLWAMALSAVLNLSAVAPMMVAGLLLLKRAPRVRSDTQAGRRFRIIAGIGALLLHVPGAVYILIWLRQDFSQAVNPGRPATIVLVLLIVAIVFALGMAGAIVLGWCTKKRVWTLAAGMLMLTTLSMVLGLSIQTLELLRTEVDPNRAIGRNDHLMGVLITPLRDFPLAFALFAAGRLGRGGSARTDAPPSDPTTSATPPLTEPTA